MCTFADGPRNRTEPETVKAPNYDVFNVNDLLGPDIPIRCLTVKITSIIVCPDYIKLDVFILAQDNFGDAERRHMDRS